ncbi:MAG: hypothetical protein IJ282_02560 [Lachnospiraceae bacterium]|nr:hypothetical protein [Lachnospiraceae bacterium]
MDEIVLKQEETNLETFIPHEKDLNLCIYLSGQCKGCVEFLEEFSKIRDVLGENTISYSFIFTSSLPRNIEEYGVDKEMCYRPLDNILLATSTPTFFLINQDGIVEFTTIEFDLMLEKIVGFEGFDIEEAKSNATEYILEKYCSDETNKKKLVYFAMKGCPDCEEADKVIESTEIVSVYDVTKIYAWNFSEANYICDNYNLFQHIYELNWYPSFLIWKDGLPQILGEMSNQELRERLLQ